MKVLASTLAICAIALATSASAKDVDDLNVVTVHGRDTARQLTVSRAVFQEIGGNYVLENGRSLKITREHDHLYAQLSGMQKIALKANGNLQFSSADNEIAVQFTPEPVQNLTKVTVNYIAP